MQYIQKLDAFVIIAFNQGNQDTDILKVRGLPFKPLIGCYKGIQKSSYLVPLKSLEDDRLETLIDLARRYDQESILIADENRECQLLYVKTGKIEYLGVMTHVEESEALKSDAWTKTLDGFYYITKKD
jgi:hypothetical protein